MTASLLPIARWILVEESRLNPVGLRARIGVQGHRNGAGPIPGMIARGANREVKGDAPGALPLPPTKTAMRGQSLTTPTHRNRESSREGTTVSRAGMSIPMP